MKPKLLTFQTNSNLLSKVTININQISEIIPDQENCYIHLQNGNVYKFRKTANELKKLLSSYPENIFDLEV